MGLLKKSQETQANFSDPDIINLEYFREENDEQYSEIIKLKNSIDDYRNKIAELKNVIAELLFEKNKIANDTDALNQKLNSLAVTNQLGLNKIFAAKTSTAKALAFATGVLLSATAVLFMYAGAAPLACLLHTIAALSQILNAVTFGIGIAAITGVTSYHAFFKPKSEIATNAQINCARLPN